MRLRTQVKQALQCCVFIAESGSPLTTNFLSDACGLPKEYLSKTLQILARAKVLVATPGPGGGYQLARLARDISALDIIEAIEGPTDSLGTKGRPFDLSGPRDRTIQLSIGRLVERADTAWQTILADSSLEDLLEQIASRETNRVPHAQGLDEASCTAS